MQSAEHRDKGRRFTPEESLTRSLRPSFRSAISRAERQVRRDDILHDGTVRAELLRELCMIMAEVYMMDPDKPIRISGEWLDGHVVQQVFNEIGRYHVEMVVSEFYRLTEEIRNKKAYLRTALYNSVFSIEAHYTNKVKHDFGM